MYAYKRFVAGDVLLAGLALASSAFKNGDKLNFKFLKYGSGFFAGSVKSIIDKHILSGVVLGLEELFDNHQYGSFYY